MTGYPTFSRTSTTSAWSTADGHPATTGWYSRRPASRQFLGFWLHEGRVVAAMNSNIWDAGDKIEALLRSGRPVGAEELADPSTDLAELSGTGAP